MRTLTPANATHPDIEHAGAQLVAEIERYLANRARATGPKTAHPLVTRPTADLIRDALNNLPPAPAAAPSRQHAVPARLLRYLPDWALNVLRPLHGGRRRVSVAEHLELTALVIERYGWERGSLRSRSGRRCILGAQAVLYRLGLGDQDTAQTAGGYLDAELKARGFNNASYWEWNDHPARTREQALDLVRTAAAAARETGR
ncbi:DUF6197 family protein [Streptomyces aculeolatus]